MKRLVAAGSILIFGLLAGCVGKFKVPTAPGFGNPTPTPTSALTSTPVLPVLTNTFTPMPPTATPTTSPTNTNTLVPATPTKTYTPNPPMPTPTMGATACPTGVGEVFFNQGNQPATIASSGTTVTALAFRLDPSSNNGPKQVTSIQYQSSVLGTLAMNVTTVQLWMDNDHSGTLTAGDTLLGTVTGPGSPYMGTFNGSPLASSFPSWMIITYVVPSGITGSVQATINYATGASPCGFGALLLPLQGPVVTVN